jgi:hypothetical protein
VYRVAKGRERVLTVYNIIRSLLYYCSQSMQAVDYSSIYNTSLTHSLDRFSLYQILILIRTSRNDITLNPTRRKREHVVDPIRSDFIRNKDGDAYFPSCNEGADVDSDRI